MSASTFRGYEPVRLVIFAVVSCGISYWGEQLYRNRHDTARITEELLATTEDLRAREAHVNSILQTVPDAMIVISEAGRHPVVLAAPRKGCSDTLPTR